VRNAHEKWRGFPPFPAVTTLDKKRHGCTEYTET
jgi:hypothetical protein